MEQVHQGIFLIEEKGIFGKFKPAVNIYVLAGNNGIIYDAGYGNKRTVKYFIQEIKKIEKYYKAQNKQFKITRILLSHSHPDHFSGLKCLRKYLDVKIILTKGTSKIIKNKESFSKHFESSGVQLMKTNYPIKRKYINKMKNIFLPLIFKPFYGLTFLDGPDQKIDENSEISINDEVWRIFPSPGHASDHISLYNEKKGILFSGDNILKASTTWLGPPDSNLKDYHITLENIASLPNLKIIFSAHGIRLKIRKKELKNFWTTAIIK